MAQSNVNHPHAFTGLVCNTRLTPPLSFRVQLLPECTQCAKQQDSVVNKLSGRPRRYGLLRKCREEDC